MSLWGKKDGAAIWDGSSGQSYTCTSGGVEVEFSGSIASHNQEVGDVLILDATSPTSCLSEPVIFNVVCFSTAILMPSGISKLIS